MTEGEKLRRDIDTLRDSIRRDWTDLANAGPISREEKAEIIRHIQWCIGELQDLLAQLDNLDA